MEERAKEVIAWFGMKYRNVFGADGGLKDAQEGTGRVIAYAEKVLEWLVRKEGTGLANLGEERPREEAEVTEQAGGR